MNASKVAHSAPLSVHRRSASARSAKKTLGFAGLLLAACVIGGRAEAAAIECSAASATDASTCLQRLVDAEATQGTEVVVPKGVWRLGRPLNLPNGVTFSGEDGGATLMPASTNTSKPVLLVVSNGAHIRIKHLRFDGGGVDFPNRNPLIAVTTGADIVFDDIGVRNSHGVGLLIQGNVAHSGVMNSQFENLGNYWRLSHDAKDRVQGVIFCCGDANTDNFAKYNDFRNIGLDALQAGDQTGFSAVGNKFELENDETRLVKAPDYPAGIFANHSRRLLIANNIIRRSQGCGIDAPGLQDSTIDNNTITESYGCGLGLFLGYDKITQVKNIKVINNKISNNGRGMLGPWKGGISIAAGTPSNITVSKNVIYDNQARRTQSHAIELSRGVTADALTIGRDNRLDGGIGDEGGR